MAKNSAFFLTGAVTGLFTLLFYHQLIGLNLLLFELFLVPLFLSHARVKKLTANGWVLTTGVAVTAIFTLIHASTYVITMNIVALFLWTGWLLLPGGRSFVSFAMLAFENLGHAPVNAISQVLGRMGNQNRIGIRFRQLAYLILPLFLVFFFLLLYSSSNPWFAEILDRVLRFPERWITILLKHINFSLAGILLLGLCTGILLVFRKRKEGV